MKRCSICKVEKPATICWFYRGKNGLMNHCRDCEHEIWRIHKEAKKAARKIPVCKQQREDKRATLEFYQDEEYGRNKQRVKDTLKRKFEGMNYRCNNPKCKTYKNYGGRGIELRFASDEFHYYVVYVLRVDPRFLHIHRIDNDGHYEPGNIEFITPEEHWQKHEDMKKPKTHEVAV